MVRLRARVQPAQETLLLSKVYKPSVDNCLVCPRSFHMSRVFLTSLSVGPSGDGTRCPESYRGEQTQCTNIHTHNHSLLTWHLHKYTWQNRQKVHLCNYAYKWTVSAKIGVLWPNSNCVIIVYTDYILAIIVYTNEGHRAAISIMPNGQGVYYVLSTASEVFLIFTIQLYQYFSVLSEIVSENILMWKIAHSSGILCAILSFSMHNYYLLTPHKIIDAKIAHFA